MITNILMLGYYNIMRESRKAYKHGLKSESLTGLRMFQSINSMIRFLVGTYSLLLAGYVAGFPKLEGLQLITRWASVASSLVFLPGKFVDLVQARALPGQREYGQAFRKW